MTEHGRKSLGLEHIILHHIASKTDSKDNNENTQITTQKSVTQNVAMVKKKGYKIESVSGDDLFNFS
jgi:hypothetical protein